MIGNMDNVNGRVSIDSGVIANYAGHAALDCFGIVGMASISMKDGLVKLLKTDTLTHGVRVVINEDNSLTIDFHIIVAYGVNIGAVAQNLIGTVKYQVEDYIGMKVRDINVYVEGVRLID